ncbi:MAG: hypothetical protein IT211_10190 [Armatimonadetes bacterium]|nr:hypothetical protein [Armatimonadota bacterium]
MQPSGANYVGAGRSASRWGVGVTELHILRHAAGCRSGNHLPLNNQSNIGSASVAKWQMEFNRSQLLSTQARKITA